MTATFKICNVCTSRNQRPLRRTLRKCPTCGAKGTIAFRTPTCEEIEARQARNDRMQALIDSLADEAA